MHGYAATEVLSPESQQLWKTATDLVELVPEDWGVRCHELARAVGNVLGLEVQDGQFGAIEHSWLWVGERPRVVQCQGTDRLSGFGPCPWEAMYQVNSLFKSEFKPSTKRMCAGHKADVLGKKPLSKWSPLRRVRHIILDVYMPGIRPPVTLVDMYANTPYMPLYQPGPKRNDINGPMVSSLLHLFHESGLVKPSLDRVSPVDPPTPPPPPEPHV